MPASVLDIELLGNARATEDVVAAPYPQLVESESYRQRLGVGKAALVTVPTRRRWRSALGFTARTVGIRCDTDLPLSTNTTPAAKDQVTAITDGQSIRLGTSDAAMRTGRGDR